MKLRALLALPALLLASLLSHAQTYEPGLLVRSNGDTLRGEIENAFWVEPPAFIRFRIMPGSAGQLFQPRQLRAVSFTGGRYFRYEALPIDHAAETRLDAQPRGNHPDIRTDSLLAEVLLEGPATVLRVVRPGATHYLLLRANSPILDLSGRRYLRQAPNGAWVSTEGNNYRNQLSLFFSDCPVAQQMAQKAEFTAAEIVALAQAYNATCAAEHQPGRNWLVPASARLRQALQGGLMAGARYNRTQSGADRFVGPCVDCQAHPFGGLYAELLQPSRTTAFFGELTVSSFRGRDAQRPTQPAQGLSQTNSFDYQALLGTARLGVRFLFERPREQQAVLSFGYELNSVIAPHVAKFNGLPGAADLSDLNFAAPTLLPSAGLGWRWKSTTLSVDIQSYRNSTVDNLLENLVGSDFAIRMGLSYRLGDNSDATRPAAIPK